MILTAHGLRITLPPGWSGRAFRRSGGIAALHAATFPLPLDDGEFGDRSTAAMPHIGAFLALAEYLPGAGLQPGVGLFAPTRIPLPLDPADFGASRLAHAHPNHVGAQHFFTAAGRPFCMYAVIAGPRTERRRQMLALDHVLRSLTIEPREP